MEEDPRIDIKKGIVKTFVDNPGPKSLTDIAESVPANTPVKDFAMSVDEMNAEESISPISAQKKVLYDLNGSKAREKYL